VTTRNRRGRALHRKVVGQGHEPGASGVVGRRATTLTPRPPQGEINVACRLTYRETFAVWCVTSENGVPATFAADLRSATGKLEAALRATTEALSAWRQAEHVHHVDDGAPAE
jgi:hypothetical protein